jgi:hypothetical protein
MSDEPSMIKCYSCGNLNSGIFFCNDDCHNQWLALHPMKSKCNHTIEDIQLKLKAMADKARSIKDNQLKNFGGGNNSLPLSGDNAYEVAKLIFG